MKKINLPFTFTLLFLSLLLNSCAAIGGIFKAGMGFGIFIVIAVILIIAFIAMRANKK